MAEFRDLRDPVSGFAWREAGSPTAPPIVFLHGLGGGRTAWDPQLSGLADDWRCIAWDLPGYGEARPLREPVTFAGLAAAAARFIGQFSDSAHVVGMSMGGMIAQYLAAFHPLRVRSLTLMSTSPKFGLDGTDPVTWRAARLRPLDDGVEPSEFAAAVLSHLAGPSILPAALDSQVAAMGRITGAALRTSIECLITHDSRALLSGITAATQCLVGSLDDETPAAYSAAIAAGIGRGASVHVIEGAGHLLHVEAPDAVNALIAEHCRSYGATP
jgi:3-oxoadipate enol-lactonase